MYVAYGSMSIYTHASKYFTHTHTPKKEEEKLGITLRCVSSSHMYGAIHYPFVECAKKQENSVDSFKPPV